MKSPNALAPRRQGFTLIELLTVVAIIGLLISILLPSLGRARDQAKRATILGMFRSVEGALEMFHNDFNQYPDSSYRTDPITAWPVLPGDSTAPVSGVSLSGAHWLARALTGFDTQGMDSTGQSMGSTAVTYATLTTAQRKGAYFSGKVYFRDNDTSGSGLATTSVGSNVFAPTRRMVLVDTAFKSPILYYRANERASNPFCYDGEGTATAGAFNDALGSYRQKDNEVITGNALNSATGWDFAGTGSHVGSASGPVHWLGIFGTVDPTNPQKILKEPTDAKNTFARYLHDPAALNAANIIKPAKAEGFVLISAGKDGIFGTDDDINNFNTAGK